MLTTNTYFITVSRICQVPLSFSLVVFLLRCYLICMTEKFRYETKEIIATLIGVALAVATHRLETMLFSPAGDTAQIFSLIHLRVLVTALTGVFFGPVTGLLVGTGGALLINVLADTPIIYTDIAALGLYGFFIGLYFGKNHYDPDDFSARTIVDFNAVQLLAAIFCDMLLLPLLSFLFYKVSLLSSVVTGAKRVVINSVIVGLVCPLVMGIVYLIRRGRKRAGA